MSSGQGVSGHLPSEYSAHFPDAECHGKCRLDDACHGIHLLDEECQGICLLDASVCLKTQNVKANVFRTTHAMASAFQMRSVRALAFWM